MTPQEEAALIARSFTTAVLDLARTWTHTKNRSAQLVLAGRTLERADTLRSLAARLPPPASGQALLAADALRACANAAIHLDRTAQRHMQLAVDQALAAERTVRRPA